MFSYHHKSRNVAALPPHSPSDLLSMKELAKSEDDDNILIQAFDSTSEECVCVDHPFVAEEKQKLKMVVNSVTEEEKVSAWLSRSSSQDSEWEGNDEIHNRNCSCHFLFQELSNTKGKRACGLAMCKGLPFPGITGHMSTV